MKIGIAITTRNRPVLLERTLMNIRKYSKSDIKVIVVDDNSDDKNMELNLDVCFKYGAIVYYNIKRKGIARSKNKCLLKLASYDYVFLFDDDCYPIKNGWEMFFINAARQSNTHHFLRLNNHPVKILDKNKVKIGEHLCANGCFIFLTTELISKVGGFDVKYDTYGFEHAQYSERIHKAGLSHCKNPMLIGTQDYIYSIDLDEEETAHSCMHDTDKERLISKNENIFNTDRFDVFKQIIT